MPFAGGWVYSSPRGIPKVDESSGAPPEAERLAALEARMSRLEDRIRAARVPKTLILDDNFLKRGFAIWGHHFVANLIIGLGVTFVVGMFVLMLIALGVFSRW